MEDKIFAVGFAAYMVPMLTTIAIGCAGDILNIQELRDVAAQCGGPLLCVAGLLFTAQMAAVVGMASYSVYDGVRGMVAGRAVA